MESVPDLLTPARAAAFLSVSPRTLAHWRLIGFGPPFVRMSKQTVRYEVGALRDFVRASVRTSNAPELERRAP